MVLFLVSVLKAVRHYAVPVLGILFFGGAIIALGSILGGSKVLLYVGLVLMSPVLFSFGILLVLAIVLLYAFRGIPEELLNSLSDSERRARQQQTN